MKTLYLIRHGKVAAPPGLCYGQSNVSLAEPASILASELKEKLPEKFELWSSPLSRCRLLAEKLGEPRLDERLMEMDFGDWEMCNYDAIDRQQIDDWAAAPLDFSPPNGESVRVMRERVLHFFASMRGESKNDNVVIVAHAGPIRILWGAILNQPEKTWLYKPVDYGEVIPLEIGAVLK